MIIITDKQSCCGCGACVQKCPKQCIHLHEDNEGFLYPQVDTASCIDCGLCEKVCPIISPYESRIPLQVFAAFNKDEEIRMQSSSGGIFTLLAENVLKEGGVVFGARFDEDWQVILDYTEAVEGLAAFRGSKYAQALTGVTFKQCEQFLNDGRKVLFTGTPCQISGLHHFLRKQYDNLITCDFVCHGVPSPKVWRMYLKEVTSEDNPATVTDVQFRNKDKGWKAFRYKMSYNHRGKITTLSSHHDDNIYMRAFLKSISLRPSCHDCRVKQCRSMSDITIADYWGIWVNHPEMQDNKGTSLVLIQTQKGKDVFDNIPVKSLETSYDEVLSFNQANVRSARPHPNRNRFFAKLDGTKSLCWLILDCTKSSLKQRVKFLLKRNVR